MLGHQYGLEDIFKQDPKFPIDESDLANKMKTKIAKARASLLLDQPFFGYLLGQFELVPVKTDIEKFAADSNQIYFNAEYIDDLIKYNDNWQGKLKFLLMHLVMHMIYRHHLRGKQKIPKIWAYATDLVVQQSLLRVTEDWIAPLDWEVPPLRRVPEEILNHNAKDTYDLLLEIIQDEDNDENNSVNRQKDETTESKQNDPIQNEKVTKSLEQLAKQFGLSEPECDIEKVVQKEKERNVEIEELEEQYFEGLMRSAKSYSSHHGQIPGEIDRYVKDLLEPKISWRSKLVQYLQKNITHDSTWSYPNKRLYGQGYYLPSQLSENITVGMAIDTSGSISDQTLSKFLSEAQNVLQTIANARLVVIDCDAEIQQIQIYETGESVASHVFHGDGGTDFRPVFEYIQTLDIHVLLYFTDGYGNYPEKTPYIPVIWVLTTDVQPPFGEVVVYDVKD